jgi:hypothetical protein
MLLFTLCSLELRVIELILYPLYLFSIIPSFAFVFQLRGNDIQNYLKGNKLKFGNELFVEAILIAPVFMALYYIKEIKKNIKQKNEGKNFE